jgi:TetR/AcrR family transcriptional repressor of nem operon
LSPKGRGQRESTRQVVLDAALRKFSEKSFLGATTIEIAEEAGVSEKTLFDLFGDKKTLYLDVREYIRRSAIRDMLPRLPIGGGAPAILRALGVEFLHEVQRNSDRARVSLQAITAIDDVDIKKSTQEYFLQTQALVTNILAEGQKAGLVKGDVDIDQFAWTYAIALHSVGHVILMDYSMGLDEEAALLFLNRLVDTIEAPR